jgi:hypothetical protein
MASPTTGTHPPGRAASAIVAVRFRFVTARALELRLVATARTEIRTTA